MLESPLVGYAGDKGERILAFDGVQRASDLIEAATERNVAIATFAGVRVPVMECAPGAGQDQAAVLTVCRAWWSSNWAGLR